MTDDATNRPATWSIYQHVLTIALVLLMASNAHAMPLKLTNIKRSDSRSYVRQGQSLLEANEPQRAEEEFRKAIDSASRDPESDEALIDALNFMGATQHAMGKSANAIEFYKQALDRLPKASAGVDITRAKILTNQALSLSAIGSFDQALRCCDEAMAIFHNTHAGPMEQSVLLNTSGRIQLDKKNFTEAVRVFEQSLSVREAVTGKQSPELIGILSNLATALLLAGDIDESKQVSQRAIAICETKVGVNSHRLFPPLLNLARAQAKLLEFKAANNTLMRAIIVAEKSHGKASPEIVHAKMELAEVLEKTGEPKIAEKTLEDALEISRITFGAKAPQTKDAVAALAKLYKSHGKISESAQLRSQFETRPTER